MTRQKATSVAIAILICICQPIILAQQMSWLGNFGPITLPAISSRTDVVTGNSTAEMELTGDCELSADNSTAARLSGPGGDVLVTDYSVTFDGDGSSSSGAATVGYTAYDSFLSPPALITYVASDDRVEVTLHARAQNPAGDLANVGAYTATQTLTLTWVGP
jgi:hypothetical protein